MEGSSATVTVQLANEYDWIKLNAGQTALLRVNYTSSMLESLGKAVRECSMTPSDRGALLLDTFALAKAKKVAPTEVVSDCTSFHLSKPPSLIRDLRGFPFR